MTKDTVYALSGREMKLLLSLVHSTNKQSKKIFDKHDNTFTNKPLRERADITHQSKSKLGRLFKKLREKGLLKKVETATGEVREMLNPSFYCCREGFEKRFMQAMYEQGSHVKACKWSALCKHEMKLIDYRNMEKTEVIDEDTGEVLMTYPSLGNWMYMKLSNGVKS